MTKIQGDSFCVLSFLGSNFSFTCKVKKDALNTGNRVYVNILYRCSGVKGFGNRNMSMVF